MSNRLARWSSVIAGVAVAGYGLRAYIRARRHLDFTGKVVLITGGSRGLGLVLARQFGSEGACVAICARDADELARAEGDLSARGIPVSTHICDVSVQSDVERLINEVEQRWGAVDVLVNNAGIIEVGPAEEMTSADFEEALDVHLRGPLLTSLAVLPGMRQRRAGRIVNISSIGGKISVPHLLPYSASKFALVGLSEGLRSECLKDGIYVTTVCPGLMRTGSPVHARFKGQHEAEFTWFTVSGSLPLVTISAERAAGQIIEACRYGDAEVVLSWPAKLATLVHGVAPGVVTDVMALVDRLLPAPGGIGSESVEGAQSRPAWLPRWVTSLTDAAAVRNNEVPEFNPSLQKESSHASVSTSSPTYRNGEQLAR